jgi:hypothetical protein
MTFWYGDQGKRSAGNIQRMAGPTAGTNEQIVRDGVAREDVRDEDAVAFGSPPARSEAHDVVR